MEYELENNNQLEMNNLNFDFKLNDRFIHVTNKNNSYYEFQSPFLKVLKPIHITYNKKKNIAKKYLILETNDELDFDNQIGDFMFVINKLHEISQEKIRENSIKWFNAEFDDIGLDLKVRRPIDHQKDNEFIKISIPINSEIEEKLNNVTKGDYVLCNILFKGLKVSSDFIMEEIEIKEIILQKEYDEIQNNKFINESVKENNIINQLLEEDIESFANSTLHQMSCEQANLTPVIKELEKLEALEELKENSKEKKSKNIHALVDVQQIPGGHLQDVISDNLLQIPVVIRKDQKENDYNESESAEALEGAFGNIKIIKENITEVTNSFIASDSKENNVKKNKEKKKEKKIEKNKKLSQIIKKSKKIIFT
jgi:hypothetical protein